MLIKECFLSILINNEKSKYSFTPDESKIEHNDFDIENIIEKINNGIIYSLIIKPKKQITINELYLEIENDFNIGDKVFINGYQSWSESREYNVTEKREDFPLLLKPIIDKYKIKYLGDYTLWKYTNKKGGFHSWNYSYIRINDKYKFIGSLYEKNGWTIIQYDTYKNKISVYKDCSGLTIDNEYSGFKLILKEGSESEVFDDYYKYNNIKKIEAQYASGWTSWYNYYTKISEQIINENIDNFVSKKIPIDIFQIDDGYQNCTGDWLILNDRFPNGMKPIADKIKKSGFKAGLWLAPFICHKNSILFKEHPEWILKDNKGKMVYAGFSDVWEGDFFALDFYNNEVRDYLKKVFHTILNEWGFDLVKLDFLYAVALIPQNNKTKAMIMFEAMEFIKSLVGDKMILGCGIPLPSAYGITQYCRISCDMALIWEDEKLKNINYRERVSSYLALITTISRRNLNNRFFINDPDVFLLRNNNIHLNNEQKHTIFLVNQIFGGLIFTSDNIAHYNKTQLELYLSQFPLRIKENIKVKELTKNLFEVNFNIKDFYYKAIINLSSEFQSVKIEDGEYFINEEITPDNSYADLHPFESICLFKIQNKNNIELIGSTGHIFPCSEIDEFKIENENIIINLNKKFISNTNIYIKIPDNLNGYIINGEFISSEKKWEKNIIIYKNY